MRWIPVVLSAILIAAFIYFAWGAVSESALSATSGAPAPKAGSTQAYVEVLTKAWQGLLALIALAGVAWTSSRTLFFGSKTAAEAYVQSSAEPFRPIIRLFDRLVRAVGRPVAIFIDDIDRCDCDYVIELLEGIQTLLRKAPVAYVVAGDHKWICSSFEKRYVDFCAQIGVPGRPLGHLFLHKVFQLTTRIPTLSGIRQQRFWSALLEMGRGGKSEPINVKELELEAEQKLKGTVRHEDIQQRIDNANDPIELETLRAAAAKQVTSSPASEEAEHRLQRFADLLEPNPRAMKLTVNAFGLNQASVFLEGRRVDPDALARWTIVQLRWPLLADYLAENWTDIEQGALTPTTYPAHIGALLSDIDVRKVFDGGPTEGRLNKATLGPILGATEEAAARQAAERTAQAEMA
jgi:hypothetical protein